MDKGVPLGSSLPSGIFPIYQEPTSETEQGVSVGNGQITDHLVREPLPDEADDLGSDFEPALASAWAESIDAAESHLQSLEAMEQEAAEVNGEGPKAWIDLQVNYLRHFGSTSEALQAEASRAIPITDPQGKSALQLAAVSGEYESIATLLSNGADVHKEDREHRVALHFAAMRGRAPVVTMLLAFGANANAADVRGNTPLHMAVALGHLDVIKVLVDAKAFTQQENLVGLTPLAVARMKGEDIVIQALLAEPAQLEQ